MTEKSRLLRARKEVVHSIKAQLQDIELFPARKFEMVIELFVAFLPGGRPQSIVLAYRMTKIVSILL